MDPAELGWVMGKKHLKWARECGYTGQASDASEHLLSISAYLGHRELAEELVEKEDIDVNIGSDVSRKPLLSAAYNGHSEIAQFLLRMGAKADDNELEYFEWDEEGLRDWEKVSVWLPGEQVQFPRPSTAIEAAALGGHEQVVRPLLFQPECKVSKSSHSYFQAIIYVAMSGDVELLKLMCKEADISPIPKIMAPTLWNHALSCAALHERDKVIRFLLEDMGAQVNYAETYDAYGMKTSSLGLATMRGYNSMVRLLLDKRADVNGEPSSDPEVSMSFCSLRQ